MIMFLADFLGNLFFAGTAVGVVGWIALVGHMANWWTLPKHKK